MLNFKINPYFQKDNNHKITLEEIDFGINKANKLIDLFLGNKELKDAILIGEGNNAKGKVYSLVGTKFCLKISELGKHVGKYQELQFKLNDECINAINNKIVNIEGEDYSLGCIPAVAVAVDNKYAYTLMIRHDNTVRLWDEENIHFKDKENWDLIKELNSIMRNYGGEEFVKAMDVNGNNILVDKDEKVLYLIDPYVPEDAKN